MVRGAFLFPAILASMAVAAGPAFAQGDVAAGEKFAKRCVVCDTFEKGKHKVGPSLYKVYGRPAGRAEGFKYSPAYTRAGNQGLVWNEETLFQYLRNPKKFLRAFLKDRKVKSRMTMKYFKAAHRRNIIAYLKSLSE